MDKSKLSSLVSVVTPCYNSAAVIEKCIISVVNQSISVKEHIIVDDGSSDSTFDIIKELQSKYPHIVVLQQKNQGAGVARNYAISEASGKYIAFLDADDYWYNNKLEVQLEFMESNGVEFSYGDYMREFSNDSSKNSVFIAPLKLSYKDLLVSCPIGCLTAIYNQELLGKIYMSKVRQGQDWSLWLKITKNGIVARKYNGVLAVYSIEEGSLSSNKKAKLINMFKIYREQQFGYFMSSLYLIAHSINIILKKKR